MESGHEEEKIKTKVLEDEFETQKTFEVDFRHFPLSVLKHFLAKRDTNIEGVSASVNNKGCNDKHPTDWNEFPTVAKVCLSRILPQKEVKADVDNGVMM